MTTLSTNEVILHTAEARLREDDNNPEVGMGMFASTAIDLALDLYRLRRSDIDFDAVHDALVQRRSKR